VPDVVDVADIVGVVEGLRVGFVIDVDWSVTVDVACEIDVDADDRVRLRLSVGDHRDIVGKLRVADAETLPPVGVVENVDDALRRTPLSTTMKPWLNGTRNRFVPSLMQPAYPLAANGKLGVVCGAKSATMVPVNGCSRIMHCADDGAK
jgi:hypothetical protein